MSEDKQVLCKALRDCINPESGRYTYKGSQHTFTIGKDLPLKKIPNHWEEIPGGAVAASEASEIETLLELQIKGMTTGRIVQFIMIYYGVKLDVGQSQETAFRQAMEIVKDPKYVRRPASDIAAGLATISNAPPEHDDNKTVAPLASGTAAPVVPEKVGSGNSDVDSGSNANAAANPEKLFKDLNADEIDAMEREEIFAKVLRMYSVTMANNGNKTVVLNKAYDIETAALEAASVNG